jgi:hypothetical protein
VPIFRVTKKLATGINADLNQTPMSVLGMDSAVVTVRRRLGEPAVR